MGSRGSCVRLPAVARDFPPRSRDRLTLGRSSMKRVALAFRSAEVEKAKNCTSTFLYDFMTLCLIKLNKYLLYITNQYTIVLYIYIYIYSTICFLNCNVEETSIEYIVHLFV
jgi:hypothetical protein